MELRRTINTLIADVYKKCNITSFPFDYKEVIRSYGYGCKSYSEVSEKLRKMCLEISNDACIIDKTIFYNDRISHQRTMFTLMHELGHILLEHQTRNKEIEDEADLFASMILAPRILIHELNLRTADDIHDYFDISITAANRALTDYHSWFYQIAHTTRKPTDIEIDIKNRFVQKKPVKRNIKHYNTKIRYLLDPSNDEYFIRMMEQRRTEPY